MKTFIIGMLVLLLITLVGWVETNAEENRKQNECQQIGMRLKGASQVIGGECYVMGYGRVTG